MYNKEAIGKRIENIRINKLNGMSQRKLGQAIGMSGQNIGLVLKGKSSLSIENAVKLCEFADVSMDYIFRGIDLTDYINTTVLFDVIKNHNLRLADEKNENNYLEV